MNKENIFKFIFMFLLVIYLCLYFTNMTGLYEYKNYKKMSLTSEQIEKFEQDVKNGKEINIDNYIVEEKTMHNNKIGNFEKKFSFKFSEVLTNTLTKTFNFLSKFISE